MKSMEYVKALLSKFKGSLLNERLPPLKEESKKLFHEVHYKFKHKTTRHLKC